MSLIFGVWYKNKEIAPRMSTILRDKVSTINILCQECPQYCVPKTGAYIICQGYPQYCVLNDNNIKCVTVLNTNGL